jgi:hypothetical protein
MAPTHYHLSEKDTPDLEVAPRISSSLERPHHRDQEGLPPQDEGRAAWTCLIAISMATWGMLYKFFQFRSGFNLCRRLRRHSGCLSRILFQESTIQRQPTRRLDWTTCCGEDQPPRSLVSMQGDTNSLKGILQSLSPFLLPLIGNHPHFRPHMMWTGMVLVVASSLGAAFSTTVCAAHTL